MPVDEDEAPAPVDFDALHAALGSVQDLKGSLPPPAIEIDTDVPDIETSEAEIDEADLAASAPPSAPAAAGVAAAAAASVSSVSRKSSPQLAESQGRSSAHYASARPHTIPPTRAPAVAPDIPAVIVADDTVPAAPPQMTAPLGQAPSGSQLAAPTSGPHPVASPGPQIAASPSYPFTPQAFPVQHAPTVRMAERPRRPRTPTVVVRARGPSAFQKIAAFLLMLLLVMMIGIAGIVWKRPQWIGLEPQFAPPLPPPSAPAPSAAPSPSAASAAASASASAASSASSALSASASASATKPGKKPPHVPPGH